MENPYFVDFDTIEEAQAASQKGMTISDLLGQDCIAIRIAGVEIARWSMPYAASGDSLNFESGDLFRIGNQ